MKENIPTFISLELVNFMCHKHLKINFKKQVTLISGLNGSGKSAIMIAIGTLLGQRVNKLERGNSYKDLIKTGESACRIMLVLNNSKERFQYDFFGNEIIIEKRINTNTGSSLIISNVDKRIWSKRVSDLERILCYFNLRFENPLNFLTQEQAKKFLNTSKPELLYDLFMRGTGIADTKEIHSVLQSKVNEMKGKIDILLCEIEKLQIDIKKKEDKIAFIMSAKECEKELDELQIEKSWSKIDYLSLQQKEAELESAKKDIIEKQKELDEARNEYNNILSDEAKREQENEQARITYERKIREIEDEIFSETVKIRDIESDLKEIEDNIKTQKQKLEEQEKLKNVQDIDEKKNILIKKKEELKKIIILLNESSEKTTQLNTKIESQNAIIESTKTQINMVKRQIEDNKQIKKNNLSFFNGNLQNLLENMKRIKFKDRVIGPLANEIKLKEKMWYKPVSIILKNILGSFIVFNEEDRRTMHGLLKKYRIGDSTIYIPSKINNVLYKYDSNRNYKTILDVLEIKDNIVANQLMLVCNIEQIILIEKRNEAFKVIRSKPRFVEMAYTINGDQIKMFNDSLSDFSHSNNNGKYYFQNSADRIGELQEKLRELNSVDLKNHFKIEYEEEKRKFYSLESKYDQLKLEIPALEKSINNLENLRDNFFAEDVEKIRSILNSYISQQNDALNAFELCKEKEKNKTKMVNDLKLKIDLLKNQSGLEDAKKQVKYRILCVDQHLNKKQTELYKLDNEKNTLKNNIENQEFALLTKYKTEKPKIIRSTNVIDDIINNLLAMIELRKKSGNEEDIRKEIEEDTIIKENKEKTIDENQSIIVSLSEFANFRIKRREEIKIKESARAAKDFKIHMKKRNYEGELIFDHDKEKLDMKVKLAHNNIAGDKNTLSGGERSFSGISFLLSLWPSVSCPVKILDEFDVYMDNLNRKCALKSIIDYFSRKSTNVNQIIIISPLDTNDIFEENCEVIALEPPRKKKTLNVDKI